MENALLLVDKFKKVKKKRKAYMKAYLSTDALLFYSMNNDGSRIDNYDFRDKIFEESNMLSHFTNNKK